MWDGRGLVAQRNRVARHRRRRSDRCAARAYGGQPPRANCPCDRRTWGAWAPGLQVNRARCTSLRAAGRISAPPPAPRPQLHLRPRAVPAACRHGGSWPPLSLGRGHVTHGRMFAARWDCHWAGRRGVPGATRVRVGSAQCAPAARSEQCQALPTKCHCTPQAMESRAHKESTRRGRQWPGQGDWVDCVARARGTCVDGRFEAGEASTTQEDKETKNDKCISIPR